MFGSFDKWLADLQNSSVERKRKWLIGLSAAAMIIIVAVWLTYFRTLVALPIGETKSPDQGAYSPSFLGTMAEGFRTIGRGLVGGFSNLGSVLKSPRSYIIQPPVN